MIWVFASCALLVAYSYIGYPALLWGWSKIRPKRIAKAPILPSISLVMAVHNGAKHLPAKLANLRAINYPSDKIEIVVASDGSTDETDAILRSASDVHYVSCPRTGKAGALNRAIERCSGEVVILTDVRQEIESTAITELAANFADPAIGCVSGELMFRSAGEQSARGVSAYWSVEKLVRKLESATGSVIGATGALYAVRRELIPVVPQGTLLDDVFIPLFVLHQKRRVIFDGNARIWDDVAASHEDEFRRKVRTLAGNYQLLQLAPWALADTAIAFRFVSHKLLRLIVPWMLIAMLATSLLGLRSPVLLTCVVLQVAFYVFGCAAIFFVSLRRFRLASIASTFLTLNAAAFVALFSFIRHRENPILVWSGPPSHPIATFPEDVQRVKH